MNKLICIIMFFIFGCSHAVKTESPRVSMFMGLVNLEYMETIWTEDEKDSIRTRYENLLKKISLEGITEAKTLDQAKRNLEIISKTLEGESYEFRPYEDVLFLSDFFNKKKADQLTLCLLYYSIGQSLKLPITVETDVNGLNLFVRFHVDSNLDVDWIPESKSLRVAQEPVWKGDYPSSDPMGLVIREYAWKSFIEKNFAFSNTALLFSSVNKLPRRENFLEEAHFFSVFDHKEKTINCNTFKDQLSDALASHKISRLAVCHLVKKEWAEAINLLKNENSDYLSVRFLMRAYFYNKEYQKAYDVSQTLVNMLKSWKKNEFPERDIILFRELKFQNAILKKL